MGRAAVVLASLLGAAALALGVMPTLTRDRAVSLGPAVVVNAPGVIKAHNSPTVVRNPRRETNLVVVHRLDRPGFSAELQSSDDEGRSWVPTDLPLPDGLDRPFAPDAAFGPDGTLYVSYVNLTGSGNVPDNLWLARSSDGGRTLSEPVRVTGKLAFQARLMVAADGTVHLTWLQAEEVGVLRLSGAPAPIVAVRSEDGGRTFSPPVEVSDPDRPRVGAASAVEDSRGSLVVLYQDFRDDRRDFENLEGPPWDHPFALVVTRSVDGGRTFSRGVEVDAGLVATRRFLVFLPEFPSLAASSDGSLYVAWADGRAGDDDVFLARSRDGGLSWSGPVRVNDNRRADGTSQYLPRVAVAPDGRVDVVFYDRRNDPTDIRNEVYLAYSRDGGETFRNLRISPTSFDSRVGPSPGGSIGPDLGSRLALTSMNGRAVAAWTDTTQGNDATGRQDIALRSTRLPAAPSGDAGRLALAAGLLVAGGTVLGADARSRRRRPPAPVPDGAASERHPVAAGGRSGGEPGRLAAAGAGTGVWAILPVISGPALNTATRVEIADHLLPSIVVLAAVVATIRGRRSRTILLATGFAVSLAGLWMTLTHVPLLAQALGDEVTWSAALYHVAPGVAVLALGMAWLKEWFPPERSEVAADSARDPEATTTTP